MSPAVHAYHSIAVKPEQLRTCKRAYTDLTPPLSGHFAISCLNAPYSVYKAAKRSFFIGPDICVTLTYPAERTMPVAAPAHHQMHHIRLCCFQ
jgi:hypothetical protein